MSDFYKPFTIDYGVKRAGQRSKRQREVFRKCGCSRGRACSCEANAEKVSKALLYCMKCKNCKKNEQSLKKFGRIGRLKCLYPPKDQKDIVVVQLGEKEVRLRKDQVKFFKEKNPEWTEKLLRSSSFMSQKSSTRSMLKTSLSQDKIVEEKVEQEEDQTEEKVSNFEDFAILERGKTFVSSFASISWMQLHLVRHAQRIRSEELERMIEEKQKQLKELQYESDTLESRIIVMGAAMNEYVDTLVSHGTWQRVPIQVAAQELKVRIAHLEEEIKDHRREQVHITKVAQGRAAKTIQRAARAHLRRKQERLLEEHRIIQCQIDGALAIQRTYRGHRGRERAKFIKARLRLKGAATIQRYARGMIGRALANRKRHDIIMKRRHTAATFIQKSVRKRTSIHVAREERKTMMKQQLVANNNGAATKIQSLFRGHLARKKRRARRVELSLGPRVRELCNRFIAKGDLFSFLEAVNRDYELHMAQQAELRRLEMENATTFIEQVLAHREADLHKKWKEWEEQKMKMKPNLRAAIFYESNGQFDPNGSNAHLSQESIPFQHKGLHKSQKQQKQRLPKRKVKKRIGSPCARNPFNQSKWDELIEKREAELVERLKHPVSTVSPYSGGFGADGGQKSLKRKEKVPMTSPRTRDLTPSQSNIVVIPNAQSMNMDPVANRNQNGHLSKNRTALEIAMQDEPPRISEEVIRRGKYNQPRAQAINFSDLDEPIENFLFQASLRCLIESMEYGDDRNADIESRFEQFCLSAPPTLKMAKEEEALESVSQHVANLKDKGIHTCADLRQCANALEEAYKIPKALAECIRKMLGELIGSLDNVRPGSVQEKWKRLHNSNENDERKGVRSAALPNSGLPPKSKPPRRASTAVTENENDTGTFENGTPSIWSHQMALYSHFPTTQRPITGDTVKYLPSREGTAQCEHPPGTSGSMRWAPPTRGDDHGNEMRQLPSRARMDSRDTVRLLSQHDRDDLSSQQSIRFQPPQSRDGIQIGEGLEEIYSCNRKLSFDGPMKLPDRILEQKQQRPASVDGGSRPANVQVTFLQQEITDFTKGDEECRPCSRGSEHTNNGSRPNSQASSRSRPKTGSTYASTLATVDWNHGMVFQIQDGTEEGFGSRPSTHQSERSSADHGKLIAEKLRQANEVFIEKIRNMDMMLEMDNKVDNFLMQIMMKSHTLDGISYEAFLQQLAELPPEADTLRRELLRERLFMAREAAKPFVEVLENAGFGRIRTLAACPLVDLGIPKDLAKEIQNLFQRLTDQDQSENMEEKVKTLGYDPRYMRSDTDIPCCNREPLPPVKTRRMFHDRPCAQKSPKTKVIPRPRKEQLISRVLERSNVVAKHHMLRSDPKQDETQEFAQSYFHWKMSSKLGHDTLVATTEELMALEQRNPLNDNVE